MMLYCKNNHWKVFRIGTVRYHWPMSAHASQAFSIASCTDSEDLPNHSPVIHHSDVKATLRMLQHTGFHEQSDPHIKRSVCDQE